MNNEFKEALRHYFADDSNEAADHFFYNCAQMLIAAHKSGQSIVAPMSFVSIQASKSQLGQTN
jgi:hypothetical protein